MDIEGERSQWSGNIQMGMISIPIRLVNIEDRKYKGKAQTHYCHEADGGSVSQWYVCEVCGEQLKTGQLGRKTIEGVVLTNDDINSSNKEASKAISILKIVDAGNIPSEIIFHIDKKYLISKQTKDDGRACRMLWDIMRKDNLVMVAKVQMRSNSAEKTCLIIATENGLYLETLTFSEQIKHNLFVENKTLMSGIDVSSEEIGMAQMIINNLKSTEPFTWNEFSNITNDRLDRLRGIIENKKGSSNQAISNKSKDSPKIFDQLVAEVKRMKEEVN